MGYRHPEPGDGNPSTFPFERCRGERVEVIEGAQHRLDVPTFVLQRVDEAVVPLDLRIIMSENRFGPEVLGVLGESDAGIDGRCGHAASVNSDADAPVPRQVRGRGEMVRGPPGRK
jgi:hypothetical protein